MKHGVEVSITGLYLRDWNDACLDLPRADAGPEERAAGAARLRENTMAYQILKRHDHSGRNDQMALRMDALVSPDNVYVSVIQTARASGLQEFPVPFVLTNCHNSLCGIGGTINEDDHSFGYSCAKRYGGIMVPAYQAVIHQFMREQMAFCGAMIMGSDSHTRYGALGTLGIGEGGGELVKQLLGQTYELPRPQIVAVRLHGALRHGTGPHDVALSLIGSLFPQGLVKNKILEFFGDGVSALSMDARLGIDAMMTECAALSTIWITDEKTEAFYKLHHREEAFRALSPVFPVYYDGVVDVYLDQIQPMIALPFHPSNVYSIQEFNANSADIIHLVEEAGRRTMPGFSLSGQLSHGRLQIYQGAVAGCVGGLYENICMVRSIIRGMEPSGVGQSLHVFPASQSIYHQLAASGIAADLSAKGAVLMQASCGPCFGVQDIPANNQLVMRHITRNFLNREGARPTERQAACVALMDARSIAATFRAGGALTGADTVDYDEEIPEYRFHDESYRHQVYWGYGKADHEAPVVLGPNIADWPEMEALPKHLLLQVTAVLDGSVTTDELVPSGEASAYRSNPEKLAEFTLQNRDAGYYGRARAVRDFWQEYRRGAAAENAVLQRCCDGLIAGLNCRREELEVGSVLIADKIGDGSAREQAASSQRVLGGRADIAREYATKRFRSNLINWGMLPLQTEEPLPLKAGDLLLLRDIRAFIQGEQAAFSAVRVTEDGRLMEQYPLTCPRLTEEERRLLLAGSLINASRYTCYS